jgi:hypothetical protein
MKNLISCNFFLIYEYKKRISRNKYNEEKSIRLGKNREKYKYSE